ncbi:hypothetical protein HY500_00735 [Candidatus Woesearchaeota archaeon]|nr:hypothetical protein [Candidatus Woesearchaeota archaeon]
MVRGKKGAELSMNVIVIVIILVIVLVVLVAFFLGGFSQLVDRIKSVGPDNKDSAIQDCSSKCLVAQSLPGDNAKERSSYCRKLVKVDSDGDGKADQEHHCWSSEIGEQCPGVTQLCQNKYNDFETI